MQHLELLGMPGSPYTRKMLSLLRYRRIAHRVLWGSHFDPPKGYPAPKIKLLPTFYFPTAHGIEAVVDSTPIIQRLENEYSARSVRPDDPLLNFLDLLIEDFADEWLTKAMFHYRWHYAEDGAHAAPLLIFSLYPQLNSAKAKAMGDDIAQRQIFRLPVVGSSDVTTPVIESSFERLVGIMDRIIARQGFVLGLRPSSADFAIFGQLTQLGVIDPTPARYLERHSPRLRAWIDLMEDLSGHTSDKWLTPASAHDHLGELLSEIGRVYAPFLLANEQAILKGHAEFEARIDGQLWRQAVFPYQHKCLDVLRQARLELQPEVRQTLDALLAGTGCESLFALT